MTSKQETDDAIYTIKQKLFKLRRLVMALWGEVREVEPSNYKALHQEVLHLVGEVPIGDRFSGSLHALEDIKEVQSFRLRETVEDEENTNKELIEFLRLNREYENSQAEIAGLRLANRQLTAEVLDLQEQLEDQRRED